MSPALADGFLTMDHQGNPHIFLIYKTICLFFKLIPSSKKVRCVDTSNLCVKEVHGSSLNKVVKR